MNFLKGLIPFLKFFKKKSRGVESCLDAFNIKKHAFDLRRLHPIDEEWDAMLNHALDNSQIEMYFMYTEKFRQDYSIAYLTTDKTVGIWLNNDPYAFGDKMVLNFLNLQIYTVEREILHTFRYKDVGISYSTYCKLKEYVAAYKIFDKIEQI